MFLEVTQVYDCRIRENSLWFHHSLLAELLNTLQNPEMFKKDALQLITAWSFSELFTEFMFLEVTQVYDWRIRENSLCFHYTL